MMLSKNQRKFASKPLPLCTSGAKVRMMQAVANDLISPVAMPCAVKAGKACFFTGACLALSFSVSAGSLLISLSIPKPKP